MRQGQPKLPTAGGRSVGPLRALRAVPPGADAGQTILCVHAKSEGASKRRSRRSRRPRNSRPRRRLQSHQILSRSPDSRVPKVRSSGFRRCGQVVRGSENVDPHRVDEHRAGDHPSDDDGEGGGVCPARWWAAVSFDTGPLSLGPRAENGLFQQPLEQQRALRDRLVQERKLCSEPRLREGRTVPAQQGHARRHAPRPRLTRLWPPTDLGSTWLQSEASSTASEGTSGLALTVQKSARVRRRAPRLRLARPWPPMDPGAT